MANKKSQSVLTWILWHPFKFAIISFLLIMLVTMILSACGISNGWPMTLGIIGAIICATVITFYTMPRGNMDRRGFIALNNVQMIVVSTAFIISTILLTHFQNEIATRLAWAGITNNTSVITVIIIAGLFYMYLCGIFFTNIYAKYQRCHSMGIAPWKIICTMPFGFGLLWTPGYLLSDETKSTSTVTVQSKWYYKLTNWIMSSSAYTTLAFAITTIYAGFFYGFNMAILTMCCAVVFALWYRIVGLSGFRQQLGRGYAYFAIAINILLIIGFIILFSTTLETAANITMNISDMATANI